MKERRPTGKQIEFRAGSEKRLKEDQKDTVNIDLGDLHKATYNNAGVKFLGIYPVSE